MISRLGVEIMRKLLVGFALIGALVISQAAAADNRHYRGYNSHGNGYSSQRYNSYRYSPRRANSYHYGRSRNNNYSNRSFFNPGYSRNYYNYSNRHRGNRYDAGSFVGGLILGSIFSSSYSNRNFNSSYNRSYNTTYVVRNPPVIHSREVVYVNSPVVYNSQVPVSQAPPTGRSLLRDLQGNCFERNIDAQGNEVRVQLEDQACNF